MMYYIAKLHNYLLSQITEFCVSYQTLQLTMWLTLAIAIYLVSIIFLRMLATNNFKDDPLIKISKAIEENSFIKCVRLIEKYPQYINKYTDDGYTPFLIACANGHTQLVKFMIRKGANVTLKSRQNESPFYLATFFYIKHPHVKNATCIRELYYAGCDINEPNDKGFTPIQMAAMFGHTGLAKWLLLKNASTNVLPDPYQIAYSQGHQDTAKLILKSTIGFSLR
ncbi:hypothetical protein NQ317_013928, partial [Molorchus minor]